MKYFVVGGAGFIGSHLVRQLLKDRQNTVVIYDNFSSGQEWHLETVLDDANLTIIRADVKDLDTLTDSMAGVDVVYHLAANPDIAKAVTQPDIDFWEGTYLTNNVLEAMRIQGIKRLIYASGSGVYGDTGSIVLHEDYSPMLPISTYGASKLACEALICAYCHVFDMHAGAFRFANVVGPNQTHGVGYDFLRRLLENPKELRILGDGSQSKAYIYVTDVIAAMRLVEHRQLSGFSYFNVAPADYITVTEIADVVVEILGLPGTQYHYTGSDRGWKGDVPVVRLDCEKLKDLGWTCQYTSREAIVQSVTSMLEDAKLNKFDW